MCESRRRGQNDCAPAATLWLRRPDGDVVHRRRLGGRTQNASTARMKPVIDLEPGRLPSANECETRECVSIDKAGDSRLPPVLIQASGIEVRSGVTGREGGEAHRGPVLKGPALHRICNERR